jgi:hypothetical protein
MTSKNTKAIEQGYADAEAWMSENDRASWAAAASVDDADDALINALGVVKAAAVLGVAQAYDDERVLTNEAYKAFAAYARAWCERVTEELAAPRATATDVRPSKCCSDVPGAVDADVTLDFGGVSLFGEVTLLPDENTGRLDAWGEPGNWISDALLKAIYTACGNVGGRTSAWTEVDPNAVQRFNEVRDALVVAVRDAAEES